MTKHAICSPSGAEGWMNCAGWASDPRGSDSADEGTCAHTVASWCLVEHKPAAAYVGRRVDVGNCKTFEFTADMAEYVQKYVNDVFEIARAVNGQLLVEQELPLTGITGERDAFGTADAIILAGEELLVIDLKFGANPRNRVEAEGNKQMMIYALAALDQFSMMGDFKRVRMMIHQPRLDHMPECVVAVEELESFRVQAAAAADIKLGVVDNHARVPGEKQCKWCANKATCNALAGFVQQTIGADFGTIAAGGTPKPESAGAEGLSTQMAATGLIEVWIKSVRAETERRLLAGVPVPGYKLVQGRRGNRAWTDAVAVEQLFKSFRLKQEQMYEFSLIGIPAAEKLLAAENPKRWAKVAALIGQSDGKPSVAPESDKRPALNIAPTADDFKEVAA